MTRYFIPAFLLVLTGLVSCLNLEPPCSRTINQNLLNLLDTARINSDGRAIKAWLDANNKTATKDGSGLWYKIIKQGAGEVPCLSDVVSVNYTGSLLSNGTVFDASTQPVDLPLSNLILGWQIGFLKLQKGAKVVFYIPSSMGYGGADRPKIPANSILVFDIEFVDLKR